ncbi:MAG TPA: hypothetical protein PLW49_02075 [bacterium]|nr:hypothetical protein [bacterium]
MKNLAIKAVIQKLEYADIQVGEYTENEKLCGYELNTYTGCGVNQIIFVDFRNTDKNPKSGKDFIELYNERVKSIDIEEEIGYLRQDKSYMSTIGTEVGYQDLKEWKENLTNVFNKKTPQQRQFEQVVDKLRSQLAAMEETLKMIPRKGNNTATCQRTAISNYLGGLDSCINGIELEDFTPNEYSGEFKLSYS